MQILLLNKVGEGTNKEKRQYGLLGNCNKGDFSAAREMSGRRARSFQVY